jgi:hypothetical protein
MRRPALPSLIMLAALAMACDATNDAWAQATSALCIVNTTSAAFRVAAMGSAASLDAENIATGASLCADIPLADLKSAAPFALTLAGGGQSIAVRGDQSDAANVRARWLTKPESGVGVFQASGFTGFSARVANGATRYDATNALFIATSRPPELSTWMSRLDRRTPLSRVVMPGAHDAGMYVANACTTGVQLEWAITQYSNASSPSRRVMTVARQLEAGVRYFDLRPYLPGNQIPAGATLDHFFHGHFSTAAYATLGCFGASMGEMIDDVDRFLAAHPRETVLLAFSHTQYGYQPSPVEVAARACGANSRAPREICDIQFGAATTGGAALKPRAVATAFLLALRARLGERLFTAPDDMNIATAPLGTLAGKVVATFDGDYAPHFNGVDGVFPNLPCGESNCMASAPLRFGLPVFDQYADSNSTERLSADQLAKFDRFGGGACGDAPGPDMFLMSWTLTAQASNLVFDISAIAPGANARIPTAIANMMKRSPARAPQVFMYDFVDPYLDNLIIGMNRRCSSR